MVKSEPLFNPDAFHLPASIKLDEIKIYIKDVCDETIECPKLTVLQ